MATREFPDKFLVAFSLAGEQRDLVRPVAEAVEQALGSASVFFDEWFEHYIAGQDSDLRLQEIYGDRCALVVVCVSERYGNKPWTLVEHEAIRARVMRARGSTDKGSEHGILPIRVGDGDVKGIAFNAIVPDVRGRSADATAKLIIARLALIVPETDLVRRPLPAREEHIPEVVIEQIENFEADKHRIRDAISLYEERIPIEERYPIEHLVDIVRRHLFDEFGPTWKMHFLVATYAGRIVGMLLCYEDIETNFAFISYLAARNPRGRRKNAPDVSESLASGLMKARSRLGLKSPRFLFEVDDPARTQNPMERRRRMGRVKLFERLAPFEGLHLRALDFRYIQPRLQWPGDAGCTRELLLCYVAPGLQTTLQKSDVVDILTWIYTALYGDDIFEDPSTRSSYGQYIRELLDSVVHTLPDQVRLLRYREISDRGAIPETS